MVGTHARALLAAAALLIGAMSTATASTPPTAVPKLPIQHHGAHPGAAALTGDVRTVVKATLVPSAARQLLDRPKAPGCQVGHDAIRPHYCVFGDKVHPKLTVALVGDSLAGQWLSALHLIGKAQHWKIVIALHSRCPWSATMSVDPGLTVPYTPCHEWGVLVLHELLTKLHPNVVIVGDRPVMGTLHHQPGPAASTEIGRGMATYWRALVAQHTGVIGLRESPELLGGDTARSIAIPRTTPITVAVRLVPHGVRMVNMTDEICGPTICHTVVGNVRVYRDLHHLTRTYTLTAAPYLERKLLQVPILAAG